MDVRKLKEELDALKKENAQLRQRLQLSENTNKTVFVPDHFRELFDEAEKSVSKYFEDKDFSPENGEIIINGERYVLMRAAALS